MDPSLILHTSEQCHIAFWHISCLGMKKCWAAMEKFQSCPSVQTDFCHNHNKKHTYQSKLSNHSVSNFQMQVQLNWRTNFVKPREAKIQNDNNDNGVYQILLPIDCELQWKGNNQSKKQIIHLNNCFNWKNGWQVLQLLLQIFYFFSANVTIRKILLLQKMHQQWRNLNLPNVKILI